MFTAQSSYGTWKWEKVGMTSWSRVLHPKRYWSISRTKSSTVDYIHLQKLQTDNTYLVARTLRLWMPSIWHTVLSYLLTHCTYSCDTYIVNCLPVVVAVTGAEMCVRTPKTYSNVDQSQVLTSLQHQCFTAQMFIIHSWMDHPLERQLMTMPPCVISRSFSLLLSSAPASRNPVRTSLRSFAYHSAF